MIPEQQKVSLYGHMIVDRIFVDMKEKSTLGGLANVWSALIRLNPNLLVDLQPTSFGEAVIVVDKENNRRISKCHHNIKVRTPLISKNEWHHIAYANRLADDSFIKKIKHGIISVDITKENPDKVLDNVKYIDFLFISDEDLFMDIKELGSLTKGWVVVHSPHTSVFSDGKSVHEYEIPKNLILNNVNVLGAGDYFAAAFINSTLQKMSIKDAVSNAHRLTTDLLKENTL